MLDAIIGALDAHQLMSTQALNSAEVREGIIDILLHHTNLYEDLRDQGQQEGAQINAPWLLSLPQRSAPR